MEKTIEYAICNCCGAKFKARSGSDWTCGSMKPHLVNKHKIPALLEEGRLKLVTSNTPKRKFKQEKLLDFISKGGHKIRIATLDTMLSFYLAFLYVNRPYYDPQRVLCMSHYLFKVQQRHRLQQKGILRRFSLDCYGDEKHTKEKVRAEKTKRYKELSKHKGSKEWEYYFLNYKPGEKDEKKSKKKTRKRKRGKSKRKTRKRQKKKGFFNF